MVHAYLTRRDRDPYSLDDLLRMTRADGVRRRDSYVAFYDLGYCLIAALDERGADLGAPAPVLFRELGTGDDPLTVFRELYPGDALEKAWMEKVREIARER